MFDLIIIGAGPTGIYAGYLAKLHNLKALILEASSDNGGQMKLFLDKPVYDMPGHLDIDGKIIMKLLKNQFDLLNDIKIYNNEEVIEIDGDINNYTVRTISNEYRCKSIIIASGGGLFRPTP